jgi:hypothetical protein
VRFEIDSLDQSGELRVALERRSGQPLGSFDQDGAAKRARFA